ncbi:hypothetical protein GCM10009638_24760 [Luteococcus sanguinis]
MKVYRMNGVWGVGWDVRPNLRMGIPTLSNPACCLTARDAAGSQRAFSRRQECWTGPQLAWAGWTTRGKK